MSSNLTKGCTHSCISYIRRLEQILYLFSYPYGSMLLSFVNSHDSNSKSSNWWKLIREKTWRDKSTGPVCEPSVLKTRSYIYFHTLRYYVTQFCQITPQPSWKRQLMKTDQGEKVYGTSVWTECYEEQHPSLSPLMKATKDGTSMFRIHDDIHLFSMSYNNATLWKQTTYWR